MRATIAWTLAGILALIGIQGGAQGQPPGFPDSVFKAIDGSKSRSVEGELRDGQLALFESVQRIEGDPLDLPRWELTPMPQRPRAERLKRPLRPLGTPVTDVTVQAIWDAAATRDPVYCAVYDQEASGRPYNFYDVGFLRSDPLMVTTGKRQLTLAPRAFRFFSLNDKGHLDDPKADRVAIVIHEPHSSRRGQFAMISGLWELFAANPQQRFIFLVEGDYEQTDRAIPLEPWKGIAAKSSDPPAFVAWMVHHYVVDGALAFRLLRQSGDVPSFAIDDLDLLKKTPRQPDVQELLKKIDGLPVDKEAKDQLKGVLLLAQAQSLSDKLGDLRQAIEELSSKLPQHREVVMGIRDHVAVFEFANKRNGSMVREIARRMGEFAEAIPVVFIGNYHTDRVLRGLAAHGRDMHTAILVLDVRGTFEEHGDMEQFQDSIHDPGKHLRSLSGRKLRVSPQLEDQPQIESLRDIRNDRLARAVESIQASSPFGEPTTRTLARRLLRSPVLQEAAIDFGGGEPPEPPFRKAFASFLPGDGGSAGSLHLYNPQGEGWKDPEARFQVIATALMATPAFEARRTGQRYSFAGRWFFTVVDRDTKRVYFFEEAKAGPMLEMIEPKKQDEKNADFRFRQLTDRGRRRSIQLAA